MDVTEMQYMELASTFQKTMSEKFEQIKKQKQKISELKEMLNSTKSCENKLLSGYVRSINDLAKEKLFGKTLAQYNKRLSKSLLQLHDYVVNTDCTSSDSESED